jgi:hypothetical protein
MSRLSLTGATGTDAPHPNAKEILLEQFGQICFQFLDASAEVWPECPVLKQYKADFEAANANPQLAKPFVSKLHTAFQQQFKEYSTRLMQKDASIVQEQIPFLLDIDASGKFASVDEEVRKTCLEYGKQVAQAASINDVYSKCPSKMMDQVASLASTFVKDLEAGKMDIKSLNPMEISQRVMAQLSPKDIEEFGRQLTTDGGLEGVMSMMQSMMSNLPAGAAGGASPFGNIDPSMIMNMMSSMGAMGGGAAGGAAGGMPFDPSMLMNLLGNGGGSGGPDLSSMFNALQKQQKKR